jgi:hypothetical protein
MDALYGNCEPVSIVFPAHICYIKNSVKVVFYLIAVLLLGLGLVFITAGANPPMPGRIIVGSVLLAGGVALAAAAWLRPKVKETEVTQKVELQGDVSLERLSCRSCGASLTKDAVAVKDGAVYVECPYCSATYVMEEEPKW